MLYPMPTPPTVLPHSIDGLLKSLAALIPSGPAGSPQLHVIVGLDVIGKGGRNAARMERLREVARLSAKKILLARPPIPSNTR